MSLARGEGGGVCPRVAAVPKSQSGLIPERAGYGECDSGLISSMTPAGFFSSSRSLYEGIYAKNGAAK